MSKRGTKRKHWFCSVGLRLQLEPALFYPSSVTFPLPRIVTVAYLKTTWFGDSLAEGDDGRHRDKEIHPVLIHYGRQRPPYRDCYLLNIHSLDNYLSRNLPMFLDSDA